MRNQTQHLPTEQLADFVEGRLAPADVRRVEEHLASGCPTCQVDLAWLRETLALMAGDDWVQPPATVRAAVQQAYRQQYRPAAPTSTLGEWLRGLFPRPVQLAMAFATALVLLVAGGLIFQRWRGGGVVQTATLTYVSELGEVQPAGSDVWKPASSGTLIRSGDRIRTGESSNAVLVFPDRSAIWLGSETDISLAALTYRHDDGRKVIALHQAIGETYNRVQPLPSPDSRFEIETPAAVITVRGTEFAVAVASSGVTRVTVAKGRVAVTAQGITVEIQAGQATTVEPGHPPLPAVPAPTPVPPKMPGLPQLPGLPSVPPVTQTPGPYPTPGTTEQPPSTEVPEPTITPAPTQTSQPAAVTQPTATRPPTEPPKPTRTERPTQEPSKTPKPTRTERPTRTPEPTESGEPTEVPEPSKTREPTEPPEPAKTEEPTWTPEPPKTVEPSGTPNPTYTEEPTETPEPPRTEQPSGTPEPTRTERPTRTPEPTRTERPTRTVEPTRTEEPTEVPDPTETEEPAKTAKPTETSGSTGPPNAPEARDYGRGTGGQGNDGDLLAIAMLAATVAGTVLLQGPKK